LDVDEQRRDPSRGADGAEDHRFAARSRDQPERKLVREVHELRHAGHGRNEPRFRASPSQQRQQDEKTAGELDRHRMRRHRVQIAQPFRRPVGLKQQRRHEQRSTTENRDLRRVRCGGRQTEIRFQDAKKSKRRQDDRGGDDRRPLSKHQCDEKARSEKKRQPFGATRYHGISEQRCRDADECGDGDTERKQGERGDGEKRGEWVEERLGNHARRAHDRESPRIRVATAQPLSSVKVELGEIGAVGEGK